MPHHTSPQQVALYIHWPFCRSKCPYCDFNSHVRERVDTQAWKEALLSELDYYAASTDYRAVSSVFFGGGTPTLMPPDIAQALLERASAHWRLDSDTEITMEANPTSSEAATFAAFRSAGVNRLSMGIQSLQAEDLEFLGRTHSVGEALQAFEEAQRHFSRTSFDLIYARPGQTPQAWEQELRQAITYADGHLSLYQLTIEPGTRFHHLYHKGVFILPEDEMSAELYTLTQAIMEDAGLPAYEVSNHAGSGNECRHNLTYWQGGDYIGIGPGAHGRVTQNQQRYATYAIRSPEKWLDTVTRQCHGIEQQSALSTSDQFEEYILTALRTREGVQRAWIEESLGTRIESLVPSRKINALIEEGLLLSDPKGIRTTPQGCMVLNSVLEHLLT